MEPAAKPVEEAPKLEPGDNTSTSSSHGLSGLARVLHLPVVAQPVLEAHTKTPTATPSVVVSYHDLVTKEPANNILSSHTILESDKTV